jgi:hypothetical protein
MAYDYPNNDHLPGPNWFNDRSQFVYWDAPEILRNTKDK